MLTFICGIVPARSNRRKRGTVDFYLVRHGEAFSERVDARRPLTPAGRSQVERLAGLAAEKRARAAAVFHSGILRAEQTAEILATRLFPGAPVQMLSGLNPEDDPVIAAAELEIAPESLVLVGHLPHMSRLAALLIQGNPAGHVVDFSPASMVCCNRERGQWSLRWQLGVNFV